LPPLAFREPSLVYGISPVVCRLSSASFCSRPPPPKPPAVLRVKFYSFLFAVFQVRRSSLLSEGFFFLPPFWSVSCHPPPFFREEVFFLPLAAKFPSSPHGLPWKFPPIFPFLSAQFLLFAPSSFLRSCVILLFFMYNHFFPYRPTLLRGGQVFFSPPDTKHSRKIPVPLPLSKPLPPPQATHRL